MIDSIAALLRLNEGLRLAAYDDATGKPVPFGATCQGTLTIGYGHTGPDVHAGDVISREEAESLLRGDIAIAMRAACGVYGPDPWPRLDIVRQAVLVDVAFEIGGRGLAGFHDTLAAIRAGDWQAAHDELLDSKLARSQAPDREIRNAGMLLTGEWPAAP